MVLHKDHKSSHKSGHKSGVSREKAKEILRDGSVRGKKLTPRQKKFFGARAGGAPVKPARKRKR